ncbi:coiled-coil domain-containing protein 22 isoform X2 [Alligator mississippiensis]|uniref:coiled-coil domain-containing protein 22 isoform X2 n=1 Tax=Alligator mississippiensis TaxID=8496 RepID=UPI002877AE7B|nr:coiled-coil domain-containing protein 22 isoform X2 [Alligator mississippiensis]
MWGGVDGYFLTCPGGGLHIPACTGEEGQDSISLHAVWSFREELDSTTQHAAGLASISHQPLCLPSDSVFISHSFSLSGLLTRRGIQAGSSSFLQSFHPPISIPEFRKSSSVWAPSSVWSHLPASAEPRWLCGTLPRSLGPWKRWTRSSSTRCGFWARKSAVLLRALATCIQEQLETPWVPPACRSPWLQRLQGSNLQTPFQAQPLVLPQDKGSKERREYFQVLLPPVPQQLPPCPGPAPSLMEAHTAQLTAKLPSQDQTWGLGGNRLRQPVPAGGGMPPLRCRLLEQLRQACTPLGGRLPPAPGAPDLTRLLGSFGAGGGLGGPTLTKGSRFTRAQRLAHQQGPETLSEQMQVAAESLASSKTSEQEVQARQEEELGALWAELGQLEAEIAGLGGEVKTLELGLVQMETDASQRRQALGSREWSLRLKRRTVELLPDADSNLAKLQLVVESSAQRILALAGQWELHRRPLLDECRRLKGLRDTRQLESSRRLQDIKALHEWHRSAATEAQHKEELYQQLVLELEGLPRAVSRAAYTHRILEIVLSDTRGLQKEINGLTGKLERTFAVTDELIFKDAKRDESVRKAYKYLAALHENCSQLIQTIEDAGSIHREIRDLEEQIESESGAKMPASLERILGDLRALRQENAGLAARTHEA